MKASENVKQKALKNIKVNNKGNENCAKSPSTRFIVKNSICYQKVLCL